MYQDQSADLNDTQVVSKHTLAADGSPFNIWPAPGYLEESFKNSGPRMYESPAGKEATSEDTIE